MRHLRYLASVVTTLALTWAVLVATGAPAHAAAPITWSTTAVAYRGQTASFALSCPAAGYQYAVSGTFTYTDDSSICTAAVHAGVITRVAGGTVVVTPNTGTASYAGSTNNGVTTNSYASPYPGFTVA